MPNDIDTNLSMNWARAGLADGADGAFNLGWWLTGGLSLLLWTGLVLLLTVA